MIFLCLAFFLASLSLPFFSTIISSHRADRVYGSSESQFAIPQATLLLPLLIGLSPQVYLRNSSISIGLGRRRRHLNHLVWTHHHHLKPFWKVFSYSFLYCFFYFYHILIFHYYFSTLFCYPRLSLFQTSALHGLGSVYYFIFIHFIPLDVFIQIRITNRIFLV